jgi:hypothetical protein
MKIARKTENPVRHGSFAQEIRQCAALMHKDLRRELGSVECFDQLKRRDVTTTDRVTNEGKTDFS